MQKQLSAHAGTKNKSLTLGMFFSKQEKKRKSRARDKVRRDIDPAFVALSNQGSPSQVPTRTSALRTTSVRDDTEPLSSHQRPSSSPHPPVNGGPGMNYQMLSITQLTQLCFWDHDWQAKSHPKV
ncbi:hypothetical protein M405DRAFT_870167 [Rhizopogon salebrosus TDB-379]|nr:hypothetical protein M405DRAFT_870167 [Rhizopogon salebrosus TDB-379]